ncbi:renalase-like [Clytia hemisphaerica]|uniref:renalase-like n=1 Tax=Clytia hemisphaerica TaxID=252671 RepID=UPI0034D3FEEB
MASNKDPAIILQHFTDFGQDGHNYDCFKKLKDFVAKNKNVSIYVKYTSFYCMSVQKDFDRVNSKTGSHLKITPFTDSDWRILNRGIKKLIDTKVQGLESDKEELERKLKEVQDRNANELGHGIEKLQVVDKDDKNDSEAVIKTSTLLKQIDFHDNKAVAMGDSDDVTCHADVVVVTIPTPQILNLKGDFENTIKPFMSGPQNVQYSSRYVMGLIFAGISNIQGIDWSAKYIYDNPCIRYVALDTKKRDQECEEGLSMVVHTSVPFSIPLIDHQFDQVEPTVLDNLKQVIPNLPEPTSKKFMRWRYSQVSKPYNGGEQGCLVVKDSSPLVILAGDAFTHSNLDGCISFGDRVFDIIRKSIES